MGSNYFEGVNRVCAQCVRDCKQFENVTLINCPKFQSNQSQTPLPCSYGKRTRMRIEVGKSGS